MSNINELDPETINQIAAGEVVERPSSVVKELVENAIDARATAITVEIRDGGMHMIRVTDNGSGIEKDDIPLVFKSHATSKIHTAGDLLSVRSLGFRGEALSSIAAVSQVELVTKTQEALCGIRCCIEDGKQTVYEEIGAPSGTTMVVRNLFYHTPARKKFLKSETTEAGYISDLLIRLALSHPEISFRLINNRQNRLHTAGNTQLKDIVYNIYGRDITANLLTIEQTSANMTISGFIGKPLICRGNRAYENYFINGRYIKSPVITKAIEEAYKNFVMVHKFPFTAFHLRVDPSGIDVNVHPTKMEVRFHNPEEVYQLVFQTIRSALQDGNLIPFLHMDDDRTLRHEEKTLQKERLAQLSAEPFEENRRQQEQQASPAGQQAKKEHSGDPPDRPAAAMDTLCFAQTKQAEIKMHLHEAPPQKNLFTAGLLETDQSQNWHLIGQLFETYWLIEAENKLFIIDQHAAHEKVLYEKLKKQYEQGRPVSQMISPPVIITLSMREEQTLHAHIQFIRDMGFEAEDFGSGSCALRAVPADLYGYSAEALFAELLDSLIQESETGERDLIFARLATMACKAAVKGNHKLSFAEAEALIAQLFALDNPYNCPHGRPTIISMTKYELEKKFGRIQSQV